MKKVVLRLELPDDEAKKKVLKKVSSLAGVDSISMDMKDKKLTVTGDIDPINIVSKLRKLCHTEILTVGPAKQPEKKKEEPKKEDSKKQEDQKKKDPPAWIDGYPPYYYYHHHPHVNPSYYAGAVVEEPTPNCVIS